MAAGTRGARLRLAAAPAPAPAATPAAGLAPLGAALVPATTPRPPPPPAYYAGDAGPAALVSVGGVPQQAFEPLGVDDVQKLGARLRDQFGDKLPDDPDNLSFESLRAEGNARLEQYQLLKDTDDPRVHVREVIERPGMENMEFWRSQGNDIIVVDRRRSEITENLTNRQGMTRVDPYFVNRVDNIPGNTPIPQQPLPQPHNDDEPDDVEYPRPPVVNVEAQPPQTPPTPTKPKSFLDKVPEIVRGGALNAAEQLVEMFEVNVVEGEATYPPVYKWNMDDYYHAEMDAKVKQKLKIGWASRYVQYLTAVAPHAKNYWGVNFKDCKLTAQNLKLLKGQPENRDVNKFLLELPGNDWQERAIAYAKERSQSRVVPMEE